MNTPYIKLVAIFALLTGVALSSPVLAEPDSREGGRHMRHLDGDHRMGGPGYGGGYMHGARWRQSLSDEQRKKIEKIKLDYVKKKAVLKASKKALKIDLALLATKNNVSMAEINRKIDQYVKIKKQLLRIKYSHLVAVRNELTAEQRVNFDLGVMRKSRSGKYRRH